MRIAGPVRILLALSMLTAGLATAVPAASAAGTLPISVLSNRADLISGGEALVVVGLPKTVKASKVRVHVGSRDVTKQFASRANGQFAALLNGLKIGRNTVTATAPGYSGKVVITNHPNGGPVFSGPQSKHYVCQAGAVDKSCNQPVKYELLYKSTNPLAAGLQPYDESDPPSDVATTTTDRGVTVPFVVRQETGYQARDQYKILTLFRAGQPWQAWAPQEQWNHKVLVTHGGSCGASMTPGEAPLTDLSGTLPALPGVANVYETALGRGFAVMSTALDNTGHNCNLVAAAESLVMAKERLVERYGPIRYTIGVGCSGGSIAEQTVANAYPGIYQGLVTGCTYPDAMSTAAQFADLHVLRTYFEDPSRWAPGVLWSPTQWGAVEGHLTHLNAITTDELFLKAAINPSEPCPGSKPTVAGDRSTLYDAGTNPGGVRCSVPEMMKNPLGPRPESRWSAAEKKVGYGFAGLPVGNTGVLYGLGALKQGLITADQFVDLNVKVGGVDIDGKHIDARLQADTTALKNSFRTGLINEFQNVSGIPIINHGGPDPGIAHDYAHAFWVKERLVRSQGHTRNRVMWFGVTPLIGDIGWDDEAFLKIDEWLANVEKDKRNISLSSKIERDRPADVADRCANIPGLEIISGPDGPLCQSRLLQTYLGSPRTVAGGDEANDHNQCVLKPLAAADFTTKFTDAQWASLKSVFPKGVCDWNAPGVGQNLRNQTWLTYSTAAGSVIYGGANLPARPSRSQTGWASAAFRPLLDQ
ncbi:hypothetical protein J2X11_002633 [Aeromicrobium panaciterrae]|uniref:DUF6351 domain-containing protein n=1 Tax=Aeromicrobium panaciterrae TaxID=363861 RepID=A0ABU1URI4_9ACTN|nr:DUF6351 family protein [Aeromicrobium panaciterrae]MDR7087794.1 hypothetical protein [Aeromicrobium panaciterrae]